jgi:hypothetical protein
MGDVSDSIKQNIQNKTKTLYLNCLEDVCSFLSIKNADAMTVQRARASLQILQKEIM